MNLNKVLIISFSLLILLVAATFFQVNRSKNARFEKMVFDNEILTVQIHCVPEIIRSYEKVKDLYGYFRHIRMIEGRASN